MWTKRRKYLTNKQELADYLETVGYFKNYTIESFSYDSNSSKISLNIEKIFSIVEFESFSPLIWDLSCEGVTDISIQDLDNQSGWFISGVILENNCIDFQLVVGNISFKFASFSLGIPHQVKKNLAIPRIRLDYLLRDFQAGSPIKEVIFDFQGDDKDIYRSFGYKKGEPYPYWANQEYDAEKQYFSTMDDLVDAKIYDGKSLKERWSEVAIYNIDDLSLEEWLSYFPHAVDPDVSEEDDNLFVNGVELVGFIDEDFSCPSCRANRCYLDDYDAYFCPYCNRWSEGDRWDNDEIYCFQKRPLEPELLWKPTKKLNFCNVQYRVDGESYTYYCPDETIQIGDCLLVPVGKNKIEKEAKVVKVFQAPANRPPYPLDKIKTISQKIPDRKQEEEIIRDTLLNEGIVCDLSSEKLAVEPSLAYDILQTPIGNFWLELNDQPIKMSIKASYPTKEAKYFVEASYFIMPHEIPFEQFHHLKICTDIDFRRARLIDNLNGEHQAGYNWQVENYDIGIVAHPYSYDEWEVDDDLIGLPYYADWYEEYQELYGFTVAWKEYVSDEDLSIWFNI